MLTSLDAYAKNDADLNTIREKSLVDIETNCGGANFPVFIVSNTRYQKGRAENKAKLVELSGIPELRAFLQQNVPVWRDENSFIRLESITREKNTFVEMLGVERQNVMGIIDRKTADLQSAQNDFIQEVQAAVDQYYSDDEDCDYEQERLDEMREELDDMRRRWENDRANYDD